MKNLRDRFNGALKGKEVTKKGQYMSDWALKNGFHVSAVSKVLNGAIAGAKEGTMFADIEKAVRKEILEFEGNNGE